ncbi:MAG TPA: hypothetical protein VF753_09470 [Terriglobales bacterium]
MWRPIYHEFLRWAKISRRTTEGYKRTEITVETDQILVLRKSRTSRNWCAECGREVEMVTVNNAGVLTGGNAQTPKLQAVLPGGRDDRGWHWSQDADGTPLICLESLLKMNSGKPSLEKYAKGKGFKGESK